MHQASRCKHAHCVERLQECYTLYKWRVMCLEDIYDQINAACVFMSPHISGPDVLSFSLAVCLCHETHLNMTVTDSWRPLVLLLRLSCGVSAHQGDFVIEDYESWAPPPTFQPTTSGYLSCAFIYGKARLTYEVKIWSLLLLKLLISVLKACEDAQLLWEGGLWESVLVVTLLSLTSRYSWWSQGNTLELRVDLLFLFHSLKQATGGVGGGPSLENMRRPVFSSRKYPPGERPASGALQDTDVWGDGVASTLPALDLGLVLGCSQAASWVSCETGGVHLSHAPPFMALYYRWRQIGFRMETFHLVNLFSDWRHLGSTLTRKWCTSMSNVLIYKCIFCKYIYIHTHMLIVNDIL